MHTRNLGFLGIWAFLFGPSSLLTGQDANLRVVHAIRAEAFDHSGVMDHEFYLSDVFGPRLTNSPAYLSAANWVVTKMREYGINAHLETFGPFGRSWTYTHFEAHLISPQYAPLIGFPLAWTPGTSGTVTGEAIAPILNTEEDLQKFRGRLKGKIVLVSVPRELQLDVSPIGRRWTDAELAAEASIADPSAHEYQRPGRDLAQPVSEEAEQARQKARQFATTLRQFIHDEEPLLVVQESRAGEGGTVVGAGVPDGQRPDPPPTVVLAAEHYNRVVRLLEHKIPVKLQFNIRTEFIEQAPDSVNVVAEIEGGTKKDEVVIIGAHLDSWIGGTGATDNAAGCAVMMEAMRILKALHVNLDRTVRMVLWGGEEEGLLGSRAYVKQHFADPDTMKTLSEYNKVSAYFNLDLGAGKIRGVYLQDNDMVRPIFQSWLEPFYDLGASTVTIRSSFGSDQGAFDLVGIPGFQFIQDPLDYFTRSHHSNMDVYDRVQAGDLMQASAVVAWFAYNTANRAEMLPRKPRPDPPRR